MDQLDRISRPSRASGNGHGHDYGGTGVLGREVVPRLQADGHEVAVLTRRPAAPLPGGIRRLIGDLAGGQGLEMAVRGAVPAETSCQSVAADVADRLAQIARSGSADGYSADLGGPQVLDAAELARQVLAAMEVRRSVRRIRLPSRVLAGFRAGHHLAADTPRGERTWASYLEARLTAGGGEVIGLPYANKQVRIRLR